MSDIFFSDEKVNIILTSSIYVYVSRKLMEALTAESAYTFKIDIMRKR